jgi:hypothetical protein
MVAAVAQNRSIPAVSPQTWSSKPLGFVQRTLENFGPEKSGMSRTRTTFGIFIPFILSLLGIPALVSAELLKNPENNIKLPGPGTPMGDFLRLLGKSFGYVFSGIMGCQTASSILQYSPSRSLGYAPLFAGSIPFAVWNSQSIDAADTVNYSSDTQAIAKAEQTLKNNSSNHQNFLNIFYTLCMIPTFFYSLSRLSGACRFGYQKEDTFRVDPRGAKSLSEHWKHITSGEFAQNWKKELGSFFGTAKEFREDVVDPRKARGTAIGKNTNFEIWFEKKFGRKPNAAEYLAGGAFPSFAYLLQIIARGGAVFALLGDWLQNQDNNTRQDQRPSSWKNVGEFLLGLSFWIAALTNMLASRNANMVDYGGRKFSQLLFASGAGYAASGIMKMTPLAQTPLPNALMLASSFGLIFANTVGDIHCLGKGLTNRALYRK